MKLLIFLSLCLIGALAQTEPGTQTGTQPQPQQPQEGIAWIRFAHFAPFLNAIDIFVDDLPTPFFNWVPYTHVTEYVPVSIGGHLINIRESGAGSSLRGIQPTGQTQELRRISQAFLPLNSPGFFTYVIVNVQQNGGQGAMGQMMQSKFRPSSILYDDLNEIPMLVQQEPSQIRFLNLSPSGFSLDVQLLPAEQAINETGQQPAENATETEQMTEGQMTEGQMTEGQQPGNLTQGFNVASVEFLQQSSYMDIMAGSYNLQILPAMNGQEQLLSAEGIPIIGGAAYSLFGTGIPDGQNMDMDFSAVLKWDSFPLLNRQNFQGMGAEQTGGTEITETIRI